MSLKKKAAKGSFWHLFGSVSNNLFNFIVFAILARLLSVEMFGLIAFCLLVIEFSNLFINFGINQNLIQRAKWSPNFANSSFWFVNLVGLLMSLIVVFTVCPAAFYFHSELAAWLLLALAPLPLLNAATAVFSAKLERDFKSKELNSMNVLASLVGGILSVLFAYWGMGPWAIVVGRILQSLLFLCLLVLRSDFRPTWSLGKESYQEIIAFGLPLFWIALISYVHQKSMNFFVAFVLGTKAFAFISVAQRGHQVLSQSSISPLNKMIVPTFSRMHRNKIEENYYRFMQLTATIVVPMFFGLAAVADQFILIAFGEKWSASAELLTLLCLSISATVLGWFLPNLLVSLAKTKSALYLSMVGLLSKVLAAAIFVWYGAETMLLAVLISTYLVVPIRYYIVKKHIDIKLSKSIASVLPASLSSLLMFVCINAIEDHASLLQLPVFVQLLALISAGVIIYALTFLTLFNKNLKQLKREFFALLSKPNVDKLNLNSGTG